MFRQERTLTALFVRNSFPAPLQAHLRCFDKSVFSNGTPTGERPGTPENREPTREETQRGICFGNMCATRLGRHRCHTPQEDVLSRGFQVASLFHCFTSMKMRFPLHGGIAQVCSSRPSHCSFCGCQRDNFSRNREKSGPKRVSSSELAQEPFPTNHAGGRVTETRQVTRSMLQATSPSNCFKPRLSSRHGVLAPWHLKQSRSLSQQPSSAYRGSLLGKFRWLCQGKDYVSGSPPT